MSRSAKASLIVSAIVWIASGRLCPIAFRSNAVKDLQRLEQSGPLRPCAALIDGQSAVVDRDWLFDAGRVRGQVDVADQGTLLPRPGVDAAGNRSAIKGVSDQPNAARTVGAGRAGPAGGGWAWASAASSTSSVRSRSACQVSGRGRLRKSFFVGAITWVKVIVPKRSSKVRQASSAAGTAAGSIPLRECRRGP